MGAACRQAGHTPDFPCAGGGGHWNASRQTLEFLYLLKKAPAGRLESSDWFHVMIPYDTQVLIEIPIEKAIYLRY